jgi:uncharacterized damage-inducible protein DinB
MGHQLDDLFNHNAWATAQVIDYCRGLDEQTLNATEPGVYGTIIETLRHTIDSEASYCYRVSGAWPEYPWVRDEAVGLDVLSERANTLAATWKTYLAGNVDPDKLGEAYGDDGDVFAVSGGIIITQAIHHANEHRAQICSILGSLGLEPPDVSAWGYAIESGRSWLKPAAR